MCLDLPGCFGSSAVSGAGFSASSSLDDDDTSFGISVF